MRRFGFSRWAVSLNSMPPGLEALLPPSDMRWRKDVGLLEEGKYEQVGRSPDQLQNCGLLCAVTVRCWMFLKDRKPCAMHMVGARQGLRTCIMSMTETSGSRTWVSADGCNEQLHHA